MAGLPRNWNHSSPNWAGHGRKQVACRLCDRVLSNTQALISHIEAHIAQGDIAPLRQNQPRPRPNNNHLHFPNPNALVVRPRIAPRIAPALPPPAPAPAPVRAILVERPVASQTGPSLSLTLGGGASGVAHLVRVNLSAAPVRVMSPEPTGSRRAGKRARRTGSGHPEEGGPRERRVRDFLNQLDVPIPSVVDLDVVNDDSLDLTLKL